MYICKHISGQQFNPRNMEAWLSALKHVVHETGQVSLMDLPCIPDIEMVEETSTEMLENFQLKKWRASEVNEKFVNLTW